MDMLQLMKTFVAVVEAGSFIGAMPVTGVSKPGISRHIADLEQHLGSRLLHRTTRQLSVTHEGQLYYQRCKDILQAVEFAESEVSAHSTLVQGDLKIGAPLTFGALHLATFWGDFAQQYPHVNLDIVLSDKIVDVVDESYDLVIRIAQLPDSSLISRRLASTRMICCCSPDYLKHKDPPDRPQALIKHNIVTYSYWSSGNMWSFSGPNGRENVHVHSRISTNNGDTCRSAALTGHGIVLLPDFLVHQDIKKGDLVELFPQYKAVELGIFAIYPSKSQLPLKVRRLIDFLVERLSNPPWK